MGGQHDQLYKSQIVDPTDLVTAPNEWILKMMTAGNLGWKTFPASHFEGYFERYPLVQFRYVCIIYPNDTI